MDSIEVLSDRNYTHYFTSKYYKNFFPHNTGGNFQNPAPYLKEVSHKYKVGLVGHHFSRGFFNLTKDERVLWLKTTNKRRYRVVGVGFVKAGCYPTPQHLTMEIINVMFEINSGLKTPYPIEKIPLFEYTDDSVVRLRKTVFEENGKTFEFLIQTGPEVSRLLGCVPSGSCEIRYNRRPIAFNELELVAPTKPDMRPKYKELRLMSNLCDQPLMIWNYTDLHGGPVEHVNPTFIRVKERESEQPIRFYFIDENGIDVGKDGTTSILLKFIEGSP